MKKNLFPLIIVAAALMAGCASTVSAAPLPGDPDNGRVIYETGGEVGIPCASCHSLDGTKIVGPTWQGLAQRAGTRVEGMAAVDYLKESIRNPSAYVVEDYADVMPHTFGETLTDDEIDDVIAFIYSLENE
jgi:cytochrome c oxidase subunit II